MNIAELYKLFLQYPSVETDTRKIKKGDIFFALKGPNFNGNHYAQQALQLGASFCVCDENGSFKSEKIILVKDSLASLQQLARYHREQFNIPFIAITGSNGKTTTKELVNCVLSTTYKTYTTQGNLNNHIGVPLTLLSIKKDAEMVVIEMGANHQKEIEGYCSYTLPTHGIVINCGKAHLEGFGGEEGVKKGKAELYNFIRENNGTAFINNDYDYLKEMIRGIKKIITYGQRDADFTGEIINDNMFIEISITKGADLPAVKTQLVGGYNLPNVLTAVCIGKTFKVDDHKIQQALENYTPDNSRSQLIVKDTNKIILDAYNANPTSMKAAIENFAKMEGDKKILVLGAMKELGESTLEEHTGIINLILKYSWFKVALVGKDYINIPGSFLHFENSTQARDWFLQQNFENTQMLIKGSRSMKMEKLIE